MAGFSVSASRLFSAPADEEAGTLQAKSKSSEQVAPPLLRPVDVELVSPSVDSAGLARVLMLQRSRSRKQVVDFLLGEKDEPHEEPEDEDSSASGSGSSSDDQGEAQSLGKPGAKGQDSRARRVWLAVSHRVPLLQWACLLSWSTVRADVLAGLTVCVMVIPQSMSYARIAGLPYVYGLYSACVPTFVYALFGHSRQLAVGPVAMVSLVLRAGLMGKLDREECPAWYGTTSRAAGVYQNQLCVDEYIVMACSVSCFVGVIKVLACIFKLSFLVSFVGHPMISGFSTGSAIIIGCSQLKHFFGVTLPSTEHVHQLVIALVQRVPEINVVTTALGFSFLAFLMTLKQLGRKYEAAKKFGPFGPLLCCVVGSLLLWLSPALRETHRVAHVGHVPGGLMPLSIDDLEISWEQFDRIRITAVSVALVGYMESIAIAKNLASQHGYAVDPGQELLALGAANIAGSMVSCYPVTGSFSRSAVANTTGAKTQLAGIVTAVGMLLVLLFLTPLFYYLPMFVLSAIVVNSVLSLVAYDVAIELFKVKRWDFYLWMVSFLGTLFVGPLEGIFISVVMSLCVVIYEAVRPQLTILWRVPGTTVFRSIDQESAGQFVPHVLIVRIGASMYFANASYVKDALLKFIDQFSSMQTMQYLVLEMAGVRSIDATAAEVLRDVVGEFRARGIETAFAMVPRRPWKTMGKAHLVDFVGEAWYFPSVHDAVLGCFKHKAAREQAGEGVAPNPHFNFTTTAPEVGISHDYHNTCTTIVVGLPRPLPGLQTELVKELERRGLTVLSSSVDNLQHTYQVVQDGQKVKAKDVESLRAGLMAWISEWQGPREAEGASPAQPAGRGSTRALLEALAAERRKMQECRARAEKLEYELQLRGRDSAVAALL